jgi:7,8-dihydropterin-6-yl-methyl-4-(beta-D-ribofuranosyl)aminobenzene 5'-phosphate synthase
MPNAFFEKDGAEAKDPIEDDTSIVMNLKGRGLVILSGCAHSGIINTVNYAKSVTGIDKVHVVMGGFHLGGPLFEPAVGRTIEELKKINSEYIVPCHCTGRDASIRIENEMPDKFILSMSGTRLSFS